MEPKWGDLHNAVICILRQLVDGKGVFDDPIQRLVDSWYHEHGRATIEDIAERICKEFAEGASPPARQ